MENKSDSIEGLGLMPEKARIAHLKKILEDRIADYRSLGFPPKEARKWAMRGFGDDGFPSYIHRSSFDG